MRQILDGRSEPLKKTESDIVQLNVRNSILTDNKVRDSAFREIDCTGGNNNFLKNICLNKITDNRKLRSLKNTAYAEVCVVVCYHKNRKRTLTYVIIYVRYYSSGLPVIVLFL